MLTLLLVVSMFIKRRIKIMGSIEKIEGLSGI